MRHLAVAVALPLAGCIAREPLAANGRPVQMQPEVVVTATRAAIPARTDSIFFEYQVGTPAQSLPGGSAPRYPDQLRAEGVEGVVLAQFVVDRQGRPDVASYKVLRATRKEFADAVLTALPGMRFTPARKDGREVRQLVQQPFAFALAK
jgi:TonB family protein